MKVLEQSEKYISMDRNLRENNGNKMRIVVKDK
jgi:hypothetical protein